MNLFSGNQRLLTQFPASRLVQSNSASSPLSRRSAHACPKVPFHKEAAGRAT